MAKKKKVVAPVVPAKTWTPRKLYFFLPRTYKELARLELPPRIETPTQKQTRIDHFKKILL